jgi:hypothetical protein
VVAADRHSVLPWPVDFESLADGQGPLGEGDRPDQAGIEDNAIAAFAVRVGLIDALAQITLKAGTHAGIPQVDDRENR